MFKANLNERVKVKLTDVGIAIMKQNRAELNGNIIKRGGKGLGECEPVIDNFGYTAFQLWDLMQTFGEHVGLGAELPFEIDISFPRREPITHTLYDESGKVVDVVTVGDVHE
ncbi:hypothetical protein PMSD_18450 [Paenibacillus macquariensis subsp. defensor]|nr:hypothetical protein PMSD_18450 [Paenibacillus macquariensis subsp. defensor]